MKSEYRKYGLTKALDPNINRAPDGLAFKLKENFSKFKRISNDKIGVFWGIDQLTDLVKVLIDEDYDGIKICYGLGDRRNRKIELIIQPIKFDTTEGVFSEDILKEGNIYLSVNDTPVEPPVASCPPLKICGNQ